MTGHFHLGCVNTQKNESRREVSFLIKRNIISLQRPAEQRTASEKFYSIACCVWLVIEGPLTRKECNDVNSRQLSRRRFQQIGLKHHFAVAGDFNLVLLDELLTVKELEQVYCRTRQKKLAKELLRTIPAAQKPGEACSIRGALSTAFMKPENLIGALVYTDRKGN